MREFCEPKMPVLLVDSSQHYETITFEEVCTVASWLFPARLNDIATSYVVRAGILASQCHEEGVRRAIDFSCPTPEQSWI